MITAREDRIQLFATLTNPSTMAAFFDRVADDVDWFIEGAHPLAGRYDDKRHVLRDAIGRLNPLTRHGTSLEVGHLLLDGDTVAAELVSSCIGLDGAPYDNALCWVCRFSSAEPGADIVEVREYLDSLMITRMVERNEPLRPAARSGSG